MNKLIKKKFPKADLLELLDCNKGEKHERYTMIETKMIGHSRWSIEYHLIFEDDRKFYRADYRVGATEHQDEGPWEYEKNEIECIQVEPKTETIIVYKAVIDSTGDES